MNNLSQSLRNTIDRLLLKEDRKATTIVDTVVKGISHLEALSRLQMICYLWDRGEEFTSAKYKDSLIYMLGLEASRTYRSMGGFGMRTLKALRVHTRHIEQNKTLFERIKEEGFTDVLKLQLEDYLYSIDEYIPKNYPKREFEREIWKLIHSDVSQALPIINEHADTPTKIVVGRLLRPIPC